MNIQGYQKLTLLDFPGKMACTVFTGGCNFRCPFCHNASLVNDPLCYTSSADEVLQYLEKRRGILEGVCITGGEPLLQPDITDYIKKIKAMGYLVKLDTNGYSPERLKELLDTNLIDYVAMDIKASKENYPKATGIDIDIEKIEKSVELLKNGSIPFEFRTTVVKGIHSVNEFKLIAEWIKGTKKYYLQGFKDSGDILGNGCDGFSDTEMDEILSLVKVIIPEVEIRG
jgi:pyruvate formate lyase activating enzyme